MSLRRLLKFSGRLQLQGIKRKKAQLCKQSARYLGLIISEGTRAIGPERIKPILNHPLGEGNGTPLQYSCLENPMDRGAW